VISKRWMDILEEEASNSNSDGHDDLVQSPHKPGSPKNASITVGKITETVSHSYVGVKLDATVVAGLKI